MCSNISGTPLDTPYNFSTATSMSDLRCEPAIPEEEEEGEILAENSGDLRSAGDEIKVSLTPICIFL